MMMCGLKGGGGRCTSTSIGYVLRVDDDDVWVDGCKRVWVYGVKGGGWGVPRSVCVVGLADFGCTCVCVW